MPLDGRLPETWKARVIERIHPSTREQRQNWIRLANFNLLNLNSDQVYIDLLTDSGTGSMSHCQLAALMRGDESHAGSSSPPRLQERVRQLFGFSYMVPVHQGRAAEHALAQVLIKEHDVVPGNTHSDTTRANIENRQATTMECAIEGAFQTEYQHPFKGNVNLIKLEEVLENGKGNIPLIIVTVTCNKSGGQPVSMHNLRQLKELGKQFNIPIIIHSARFAENAWFIQQREAGYSSWSISDIVREMYHHADGMIMSGEEDGLVNIGGFFATNNANLHKRVQMSASLCGELSGRDTEAFAVGLSEVTQQSYLDDRIGQVYKLGKILMEGDIPVQQPIGGHAILIDAFAFLPLVPREEYAAQTLAVELYVEAGIRGVELDSFVHRRDTENRTSRLPEAEFLRLAIPRQAYTNDQLAFVANALLRIYDRRSAITRGLYVMHEDNASKPFATQMIRAKEKTMAAQVLN